MTEMPASLNLHLGNFLLQMTLFPWSHWDFGSPYRPRSTQTISLHLSELLKAAWPQHCTAVIDTADTKRHLKKNYPYWWITWHYTSLLQGTLIRAQVQLEGNVLLLISPTVSASRMSFVGTFPWLLWLYKMWRLSSCFELAFVDIPELYPKFVF